MGVQYVLHAIVGLIAGNDPILARSSKQRTNRKRFHQIANERRRAGRSGIGAGPIESIVHIEVGRVKSSTTDCGGTNLTYYRLWLFNYARRPKGGGVMSLPAGWEPKRQAPHYSTQRSKEREGRKAKGRLPNLSSLRPCPFASLR
jgi:hypothetical protein